MERVVESRRQDQEEKSQTEINVAIEGGNLPTSGGNAELAGVVETDL